MSSHNNYINYVAMNESEPDMESQTLGELVRLAKDGDRLAFRGIFETSNDRVFRFLLGQLGDREDALDVLQEVFIDVWKGLPRFTYRSDEEFWGFVFLIARRKVFALRTHAHKRNVPVENDVLEALHRPESTEPAHRDDHHPLILAMKNLNALSREIIGLRYWSELSFKEIGIAMRISENNAKVRHHRALKELQTYLPKEYVEQQFT